MSDDVPIHTTRSVLLARLRRVLSEVEAVRIVDDLQRKPTRSMKTEVRARLAAKDLKIDDVTRARAKALSAKVRGR
ncbi:MAG: hypothetical protein AAGE52_35160 [Myxococcota bacterium]